jgi:hypothetical protein
MIEKGNTMSKSVPFYAIRMKGTEFYKGSYDCFVSFEEAIGLGVYYNQLKTAEKNLKLNMERFHGGTKRYPNAMRFEISKGDEIKYYAADQEYVREASKDYEIEFREIELEIVELRLTLV